MMPKRQNKETVLLRREEGRKKDKEIKELQGKKDREGNLRRRSSAVRRFGGGRLFRSGGGGVSRSGGVWLR